MVKNKILLGFVALLSLMVMSSATFSAQAQKPTGVTVLSANENSVTLELTVANSRTETVDYEGQTYQRIVIPTMGQSITAGAPQLPMYGTWVGVADPESVTLEVVATESERLPGSFRIIPAPAIVATGDELSQAVSEQFTLDADLYSTDQFYPSQVVALGDTGLIRDQAAAQIKFSPVQYNPVTGEVQLYTTITVKVSWADAVVANSTTVASGAYESVLQGVLANYNSLNRPHVARRANSGRVSVGASQTTTNTLKITIDTDALYKLSYDDLTNAGMTLDGVNPADLSMFNRNEEVAIDVHAAGDTFAAGDYILFYAVARDDTYTSDNIYWLKVGGNNFRMSMQDASPSNGAPAMTFREVEHAEVNNTYWQTMPNGNGQDHWFWGDRIGSGKDAFREYTLSLTNVTVTANQATVKVRLKGYTDDQEVNPDHHTKLYLNGTEIDEQAWNGQSIFNHNVEVTPTLLLEGDNIIKVEAVDDTGAAVDQLYIDWLEIGYDKSYIVEDDQLYFFPPAKGENLYTLTGFSKNSITVYNATFPEELTKLTNVEIITEAQTFSARFQADDLSANSRYMAVVEPQPVPAEAMALDRPSHLSDTANQADYIIITHRDFYSNAMTLADYRSQASNLNVMVVDVQDVYDEFNSGIFNPQAIRNFLEYTQKSWQQPFPAYVLLIGDANQDYRHYISSAPDNYVPAQIVETDNLGETPSDNWYVMVTGNDILPDMFIGRFAAQTAEEADIMVQKTIAYEQDTAEAPWKKAALFIADDGIDAEEGGAAYETLSNKLAETLPFYYNTNKIFVEEYTDPNSQNPTQDIIDTINEGNLLVNYAGHGAVNQWGNWNVNRQDIFSTDNIAELTNGDQLSVVTVANCLSGFFALRSNSPRPVSMAEVFIGSKDKGAAAVWAPTGLDYPSGHQALIGEFYNQIYGEGNAVLGDAATQAKIITYGQDTQWAELIETFVLFGDPAIKLNVVGNVVVGADGGMVTPPGENIQMNFPAGAFTEEVTIIYTPKDSGSNTEDYFTVDVFYEVSAVNGSDEAQQPTQAYQVTVGYQEDNLPRGITENDLGLYYQDDEGMWQLAAGSTVDPDSNTVSATPSHFSEWAILAPQLQMSSTFLPIVVKK